MAHTPLFWIAAALIVLSACSSDVDAAQAQSPSVRAAYLVSVEGEDGERQDLLIAGVRSPDQDMAPEAAAAARQALEGMIGDRPVTHTPVANPDRYGRIPSRILVGNDDLGLAMIEAGWLIAWPRIGAELDHAPYFEAEASAREIGAGVWSSGAWGEGAFAIRDTDPNRLAQFLDSAQIVEGRVISTGSARDGRIFLNFGLDWRTDFTAVADEEAVDRFQAANVDLGTLEGAVIRVRGWLYELNGPAISLTHPAQVELVDAPDEPEPPR